MGKAALLLISAIVFGALAMFMSEQSGQEHMDVRQANYQYQMLARNVADAGMDRALSTVQRNLDNPEHARDSVFASDGYYDVDVARTTYTNGNPLYGDLDVSIQGYSGDDTDAAGAIVPQAGHDISANLLYEVPLNGALMIDVSSNAGLLGSLGLPTLTVNVSGALGSTPIISGVDVRAAWKGGRGYLPSVVPIQTNMASSAFNLNTKLKLGQLEVEVAAGSDSTATGFDRSFYEQLYTVGKANADLTYSGFFTTLNDPTVDWGSLDDPKIVVVQGGLQISSALLANFSGAGLLIIDGGLLNLTAGNFTWEGIILVRGPVLNVQLGTGTTVHGGLIMLDKPIFCLPIIGCVPPPVSPMLNLFTDTQIMYSGETVAKLGLRLSMIRDETQVFLTHQQETATNLTFN